MTFKQTLDYLYSQLPMFTRVGASAFKKDLTNTLALCEVLDNPHTKFPTIHVAGTNGKGSTAHALAAILQAAGYKTGLYISPHYKDFRERIKINGEYISKKFVTQFVEKNKAHFERIQPSFFEMTVAMAFDYFNKGKVDIAVIEVGLGGRFDSTNVITPLVSVITNISYDHMDLLGDTLAKIAFEKAGIIKPKVPVVIGEEHPETKSVFLEKANECHAPISFASQDIDIQIIASNTEGVTIDRKDHNDGVTSSHPVINRIQNVLSDYTYFSIKSKQGDIDFKNLKVNLNGDYQIKNVATVLQTVSILKKMTHLDLDKRLSETAIRNGLGNLKALVKLMGRWQILQHEPLIMCDSAHNEGGLTLVMQQVKQLKVNQLHMVIGMVRDKDISKMLSLLPQNSTYYFAKANIPRGLEAEQLKEKAAAFGLQGKAYPSVSKALAAAKRRAKIGDAIYIGGSTFVVAEVL
jgi:dihydrofolate synthase / folylpolyglutamate synthase